MTSGVLVFRAMGRSGSIRVAVHHGADSCRSQPFAKVRRAALMAHQMPEHLQRVLCRASAAVDHADVVAERAFHIAIEARLHQVDRSPLEIDPETDRRLRACLTH
ncbi:hypothetical protein [Actinomycetospora straminea]|uniref:hypothetical protein n=1 Tax=Actinomycetospora straminea TaxID=663607 RepID=UPI00236524F3|nr:hypothetical protein [Actinomycetospora straminea]MDD7936444.1 hypothetical protein [Actinomycetospora straminea]